MHAVRSHNVTVYLSESASFQHRFRCLARSLNPAAAERTWLRGQTVANAYPGAALDQSTKKEQWNGRTKGQHKTKVALESESCSGKRNVNQKRPFDIT